jgi:hypothetical protein
MSTIQLSLPGGSPQAFPKGISGKEALEKLMGSVGPDIFALKVNGVEKDLLGSLDVDGTLEPLTFESH